MILSRWRDTEGLTMVLQISILSLVFIALADPATSMHTDVDPCVDICISIEQERVGDSKYYCNDSNFKELEWTLKNARYCELTSGRRYPCNDNLVSDNPVSVYGLLVF